MALALAVRASRKEDMTALTAIEEECFPDGSWTAETFLPYDCNVAEINGVIVGFLVSRQTFPGALNEPPEREILNLAVTARFRRAGVAGLLLQQEIDRQTRLFLEVRESNQAARNLYSKTGFREVSRRSSYYRNPDESAIVMQLK